MNPFALSGLLTAITSFLFGGFVFLKGRTPRINRLWLAFTISVGIWGLGAMGIGLAGNRAEALTYWRGSFAWGVIWIPVLFHHFVHVFCERGRARYLALNYMVALAFLPITATPYFFLDVRLAFGAFYYAQPGPAFIPFFMWWIGTVTLSHLVLWQERATQSGQKRAQIHYFFLATLIGYTGGSLDYLPIFGIDFYPYGNFAIVLYPIIMTYAILRYRLMDISVMLNKSLAYAIVGGAIFLTSSFGMLLSTRATLATAPPLITGLLVALCGALVFMSNRRSPTNTTFALYCGAVCLWLLGAFMVYSAPTAEEALHWCKAVYAGIVFIPAVFFHFCMRLVGHPDARHRIRVHYAVSTAFMALLPTSLLVAAPYHYSWGYFARAGLLHPLFLVYFFTTTSLGLYHLFQAYRINQAYDTDETARLKYSFWTFCVGLAASVDFIPGYGYDFYPAGSLFAGLWLAMVAYAIVRHHLVEVRIPRWETHRSLYTQLLSMVGAYASIVLTIRMFTHSWQFVLTGILLGLFIAFAGLLVNLPRTIEHLIGQQLMRDRYDAYDTIVQFSKSLVSILELHSLTKEIVHTLTSAMNISTASLYVLDSEKHLYALAAVQRDSGRSPLPATIKRDDALPSTLNQYRRPMVREELEDRTPDSPPPDVLDAMKSLDAEVCFPLVNKERLIGFISLGARNDHTMYSSEDLSLLTTLGQHAAIALDNALLYEDLKRSQALMRRTDRLRSLETIAGGFAHEVRNPLTSIKTFVQLVPDRRDDREFVEQFSQVVAEDVNRIERLVQEILDYARYMEPQLTEQDLNEVVTSCLYFIEIKATSRGVKIIRELAPDLPYVTMDRQQIKQVLLNLFINALDAMGERGGRLGVRTHLLNKSAGSLWVQIEVTDTGAGIEPHNLEHIFDPFYTTKHDSTEREGTGLGLTIVHQIVREHQGYIEVTSELGRGTSFFVNLPVTPEDAARSQLERQPDPPRAESA